MNIRSLIDAAKVMIADDKDLLATDDLLAKGKSA
jgi:hypothetical protein